MYKSENSRMSAKIKFHVNLFIYLFNYEKIVM